MKEFVTIWSRLTGQSYANSQSCNQEQPRINENRSRDSRCLQRDSSVVVNRYFLVGGDSARWPKSIFVFMALGLLGLTIGCLMLIFQPYELLFRYKATFGEGGETFGMWKDPEVDLFLKVYLFNVTNHEEFLSGKEDKLRFQEIGPYVYREFMRHSNVSFNNNGTVTAIPRHPLKFMPNMSQGTEEDLLILPNIALLSITNVMRESSYFTRWGLNMLIRQTDSHPLVQMTAKEFMFGYESTLVTLGNKIMPRWIKFDKLGLIDRMYDFEGDYETVYTGETDITLTGLIEKYNGAYDLPQWTGKCANVKGASDGAKFPSYIKPNDTILFFRKSLCRSARMHRTGEKVVNGIYAYHYNFIENELDNGAFNPENKCFCRQGRCLPVGFIDVTDCYYGFPIALSYPHFFKADPSVLAAVEGVKPEAEKHESYFYIQPKAGLPLDLAFRFQINMALQNIGHMERVERFDNMILPLLWFEIGMYKLPDHMITRFQLYLNILPVVQDLGIYSLFIGGVIFLIWSVIKILLHHPNASLGPAQWLESEMQRKRLSFLNERRPSLKSKEMETYYNLLLVPPEDRPSSPDPAIPPANEEMENLNEELV